MAGPPSDTGTPRWVKVSGIIVIVFVLLVVIMLLAGHGPGRHIQEGDTSNVSEGTSGNHASLEGGH